jgi:hypothetical protein
MDPSPAAYVRRSAQGFDAVELGEGTSDACFAWRVVARRRGPEDLRLPRR